jgi:hypothetical protein
VIGKESEKCISNFVWKILRTETEERFSYRGKSNDIHGSIIKTEHKM